LRDNAKSSKLLFWVQNERSSVITGILSIDIYMSSVLKIMVKVEISIIIGFVLKDQLPMDLKLIIMAS
jgi:hypothetical protein